jgi:orotate phosphoribosyltransferase
MSSEASETSEDVLDVFRSQEALLEGHFLLSSGLHSPRYLQCARVLMAPKIAEDLCRRLKAKWTGEKPDVVLGPALGGVVVAYELARAFGVPGIFAERDQGTFALRRGFTLAQGAKVLICEDVVTTGGSAAEVMRVVRALGARPIGVACLIRRTEANPFDLPLASLATIVPPTWKPEECPLCREGSTAVKPGSRPGAAPKA